MRAPKIATRERPVTTSSRKTPELTSSAPHDAPTMTAATPPRSMSTDMPFPRFAMPPAGPW